MATESKQKIKIILGKMLDQHYLGAESTPFLELRIERMLLDTNIERDEFVRVMENLKEKGIIIKYGFWKTNKECNVMKVSYDRDPKWNLCSVNVPRNFRELTKKYIEELSDNKIKDNHKTINILHFDNMGNLWHGNKEDNCYPIKTNRLAIVRYLVENSKGEEYQQTELIALAVGKKKEYVMREIGKIIDRIDTKLGLPDVIENMRGSGYRINPIYRIAPVNN